MAMNDFAHVSTCPYCGDLHEAGSGEGDVGPSDGNVSLCVMCGRFAFFDSSAPGGMRKSTALEEADLAVNPSAQRFLGAWQAAVAMFGKPKRTPK